MTQVSIEFLRDYYPQYSNLTDEELADRYTKKTGDKVLFNGEEIEEAKPLLPEAGTHCL